MRSEHTNNNYCTTRGGLGEYCIIDTQKKTEGGLRGVMVKMLHSDFKVGEFELQSLQLHSLSDEYPLEGYEHLSPLHLWIK